VPEETDQRSTSGLTPRSLLLGCVQVVLLCVGAPYAIWTLGSSEITWSFFPIGVGFPFLCFIFFNVLLKSIRRSWALLPAELITILVMGLVVAGIPVFLVGYFLAIPTTPHYFASSENQWGQYVLPYLPEWLLPSNAGLAMTWFFEGLPLGESVPWDILFNAWVMPLFWWLSFIWTLFFVCFCMVVILRRQWVEYERLAYPLMEVPQALVADAGISTRLPAIMHSKLFWIGVSIPLFIVLWNIVGFFYHFFPKIQWQHPVQIARGFPAVNVRFYFPVVGFMYFVNLNVSFSIWFFYTVTLWRRGSSTASVWASPRRTPSSGACRPPPGSAGAPLSSWCCGGCGWPGATSKRSSLRPGTAAVR